MSVWRKEFHTKIVEVGTPPEYVYNAYQTGLYYQKTPNRVYVDEANKNDYSGENKMKDKTHITLMVGTSTSGGEVPLAVVGKPKSLKLMNGTRPPLQYKN